MGQIYELISELGGCGNFGDVIPSIPMVEDSKLTSIAGSSDLHFLMCGTHQFSMLVTTIEMKNLTHFLSRGTNKSVL
jgi:hypothetical protein